MKSVLTVVLSLFLAGCQSQQVDPSPALAQTPDAEALAELRKIVERATGVASVTLTADVFSRNHILVVEPKRSGIPNVGFATGTLVEQPHTFHLLSDGHRCLVEHVNSGQRYRLRRLRCQE